MNVLIPMAGLGKRFLDDGYTKPKPLIKVSNRVMIQLAVESLGFDDAQYIFITRKTNILDEDTAIKRALKEVRPECHIIEIDYLTSGPANTCLLAENLINNSDPLIIANCDQIMNWNGKEFINNSLESGSDGVVVTYNANTEKNSYVKLNKKGCAIEFAEKKVISKHSLNGIHYWKHGFDFVRSAKSMIKKNLTINNEFYIAPSYNELILEGKKITIYKIKNNQHNAVGTPEDLKIYECSKNK